MRNPWSVLLVSCWFLCVSAFSAQNVTRKKVGVVLSGGGAKGAAHIGVLKALEEAGIPIDYIAGTSMGAVVGGLYAIGYTPSQLDSIIKGQDWDFLLSDNPEWGRQTLQEREDAGKYLVSFAMGKEKRNNGAGLVRGKNLYSLLSQLTIGYHDSIDFNRLPIPFACVATNIANGKEVVFHSGILPLAIRASMAIPGFFTPVRMDSMVLVDGGMVNNYPVDVVRDMGADIVIGSTVQSTLLSADEIGNMSQLFSQILTISCQNKLEQNIADCDLHLHIRADQYNMMDFKPQVIDSMVSRGWNIVWEHAADLSSIRRQLGLSDADSSVSVSHTPVVAARHSSIYVRKVNYHIGNKHEILTINRKCKIAENSRVSIFRIEEAVRILQNEYNYPDAYYALSEEEGMYDLSFYANRKRKNGLRAGVRFDTEDILSALLKGEIFLKTSRPSNVSITGKVGKQYMGSVQYTFEPFYRRSLNVAYMFRRNDMNIDEKGRRVSNLVFREHAVGLWWSDFSFRNFQYEAGLQTEYYDYGNILTSQGSADLASLRSDTYFNYFFRLRYSGLNRLYYPTRGMDFSAGYTLYTDDFLHNAGESPVSALCASWCSAISLGSRSTLLPSVSARMLFGENIPFIYSNVLGGNFAGKFMPQQLPFVGMTSTERAEKSLLLGGLTWQQCLGGEHYLSLIGNVAVTHGELHRLNDGKSVYGVGLQYGYNSKLGPLEAVVSYGNNNKKVVCFINLGFYF